MSKYHGTRKGITPATTADNWTLNAAADEHGKILELRMSGEVTTTNAMRTRVARAASGATPTSATPGKLHPKSPANLIDFVTTWTTQPTLNADDLFAESWNAHGGVLRWLAAPGEELVIIGAEQISCRNEVGVQASTYSVVWEEA